MPGRSTLLITDQVYHIFNRGIDRRPIFTSKREYLRALKALEFYRVSNPPVKLSKFLSLNDTRRNEIIKLLDLSDKLVQIICFCLMPNHFHFLLRQIKDKGISTYLSNFQNSYTRYFNIKHERDGSLLLDQFKAVMIETDEQLIHVSRYIHLNPYTSFVVKSTDELGIYPWSSLADYFSDDSSFIEKSLILENFRSKNEYKRFLFDQADYQRKLKEIEHLIIE